MEKTGTQCETKTKNHYHRHKSSTSDSPSSSSLSSDTISLPPPPDGGWGWAVVLASFCAHMIADGCAFSFGVLYAELLDYFGESKGKTAWVGSLFVSVPLMTGPIASVLTNRYGCRCVTMAGGFIAGIGFICSSFANSIAVLCLTFGLLAGFGLSMVYVSAVCVVAFYFEKRRAFATGIAVAGSGIGTFLFAPLTDLLIHMYTWRGAVLVLGAINFNLILCGAVFRPLLPTKEERVIRQRHKSSDRQSCQSKTQPMDDVSATNVQLHQDVNNVQTDVLDQTDPVNKHLYRLLNDPVTRSLVQLPTHIQQELCYLAPEMFNHNSIDQLSNKTLHEALQEKGLLQQFWSHASKTDIDRQRSGVYTEDYEEKEVIPNERSVYYNSTEDKILLNQNSCVDNKGTTNGISTLPRNSESRQNQLSSAYVNSLPFYRKDIFYRGSLFKTARGTNLAAGRYHNNRATIRRSASCPDVFLHPAKSTGTKIKGKRPQNVMLMRLSREASHIIHEMLGMEVLHNILFVYFCIHSFILYMWYDVPYVYGPDLATSRGLSDNKGSFVVSIIGITSTFGQILIGYVGDLPWVNTMQLYNILTCLAGISTFIVPCLNTYSMLCVSAASYGFFISGNYSLTTIILVELLGMERLTNAYGISMLAEGVANLIGPPLAGWICDQTHSYDATFYCAGGFIFLSGVMLSFVPCLRRFDKSSPESSECSSTRGYCSSSSSSGQLTITENTQPTTLNGHPNFAEHIVTIPSDEQQIVQPPDVHGVLLTTYDSNHETAV